MQLNKGANTDHKPNPWYQEEKHLDTRGPAYRVMLLLFSYIKMFCKQTVKTGDSTEYSLSELTMQR